MPAAFRSFALCLIPALFTLSACSTSYANRDTKQELRAFIHELNQHKEHTDNAVRVHHLLVGFRGTIPGKDITRSYEEAETLTGELFARIQDGEDFDALVKEHTDDAHPGIYQMKLELDPGDGPPKVFRRNGMVAAFGDTGWRLKPGEVGVAAHNGAKSPYGWHIVKRLD